MIKIFHGLIITSFRPDTSHVPTQGPLITDGRNSCKWTGPTVGLSKSFIRVKISGIQVSKKSPKNYIQNHLYNRTNAVQS